jgi:putative MATE family efflux protein
MHKLTEGSINRHLVMMSIPMAIGMAVQVLYNLIDIYFVAQLGDAAIAGVSAAANLGFLIMALTQVLSVGTVALIARAAGAKDQESASRVFNQALSLSLLLGVLVWVAGVLGAEAYMRSMAADEASVQAGKIYLYWFIPALALQFAMVAMVSALRGIGIVKPTVIIQILSVVVNAVLAPILIVGWGTGLPMGVAGAGLATTFAVIGAAIMLIWYFVRHSHYVKLRRDMLAFDFQQLKKIVSIGLPVGGEFFLMFVYMVVVYWVIKDFGNAAQAGFGIGMRVMQSFFLPVMAISFAMPAIIGQNLGAGLSARVRETLFKALLLECVLMSIVMLVCKWHPDLLIAIFSEEAEVIAFGAEFLTIISWNFLGMGVVFACSGYFQGIGNTWPALLGTTVRMTLFAIPAVWLSFQPGFNTSQLWYLSVATVVVQMILSLFLTQQSLRKVAPV